MSEINSHGWMLLASVGNERWMGKKVSDRKDVTAGKGEVYKYL
jgi:hypothetical protein